VSSYSFVCLESYRFDLKYTFYLGEAFFYPENDEELNELNEIVLKMGEASPESSGDETASYYLN